jgi:hypothetical protein
MKKSIPVKRKKRGRPATGTDPFVGIRLPPEVIKAVEAWAVRNGQPSRSHAIRAMIERVLKSDS